MLVVARIGDSPRMARTRRPMNQRGLAGESGVGVTTIIRIECNQVNPQFRNIQKLARALRVNPRDIAGENDD